MSIEEMMKDGKTETFLFYKDGELWYRTAAGLDYPAPVNGQGDSSYLLQEKAMHFMR